ncbi:hypothetical protein TRVL_09627 [Trypanosoma vivax]|nr:hypothetical protein TRVL_09627 [Trypanosoma vivax]
MGRAAVTGCSATFEPSEFMIEDASHLHMVTHFALLRTRRHWWHTNSSCFYSTPPPPALLRHLCQLRSGPLHLLSLTAFLSLLSHVLPEPRFRGVLLSSPAAPERGPVVGCAFPPGPFWAFLNDCRFIRRLRGHVLHECPPVP